MNKTIMVVAALMLVVSAMIVITIANGIQIPQTGQAPKPLEQATASLVLQPTVPVQPTLPPTQAPEPAAPEATSEPLPLKSFSLVSGSFFKQLMLAYIPRAGATLKVSTQPLRPGQLPPEKWREWPIIPTLSDRAKAIYRDGLKRGTHPYRFSKIGDCQVIQQYFLGLFDEEPEMRLGSSPYKNLLPTVKTFAGNWERVSMATRTGFNVASVLSPINSDPKNCKGSETPLQCEFRIWNPSIAVISMETWTADRPASLYEGYLRQIVEYVIARGAMPILATKADNMEKDHSINLAVARVAFDYDIPLWNWWREAQPLPSHGLMEDGFHLTNGRHDFNSTESMKLGWPMRNISFLRTFDAIWKELK